jgi:hypothetical protein
MDGFADHKPGSQHLVLHAVSKANPEREGAAEWTESQLAARCAQLCGKPCIHQLVGATLRSKLRPKGLVSSRNVGRQVVLWTATAEVRAATLA